MPPQELRLQQGVKIRRTTIGFGILQVILGLVLTTLSFTAFSLTESDRIRNACPYWAGFTVLFSGGVSIIAWRHPGVLSMGLFSFFSAVCVVLQMIGTILTGDVGGFLKSLIICRSQSSSNSCACCDSIASCQQGAYTNHFDGIINCDIIQGQLKEIMYGMCILNIFGCLVCFIATVLGCTSVARNSSRDELLSALHQSTRTESTCTNDGHEQYEWSPYPNDPQMLPSCAPPAYRSFETFQEFSTTSSVVVAPPVYDPTDFPPPYSSRDVSVAGSHHSVSENNTSVHNGVNSRLSHNTAGTEFVHTQENSPNVQVCQQCGRRYRLSHQCTRDENWSVRLPPYQQNERNDNINGENVSCSPNSDTAAVLAVTAPGSISIETSHSSETPTDESSAQEISSSEYSSSYDSTVSSLNTPRQDNFLEHISENVVREPSPTTVEPCSVSSMNYSNVVISNARTSTIPESVNSNVEHNYNIESVHRVQRSQRPPVRACLHHNGTSIIPPNVELPVDFNECNYSPSTIQNIQASPSRNKSANKRNRTKSGKLVQKKMIKSKHVRSQQQRPRCSAVEDPKTEAVGLIGNESESSVSRNTNTSATTSEQCVLNPMIPLSKETVV